MCPHRLTVTESKKALTEELLAGSDEIKVTEMPNNELLRLLAFDLQAMMED
ncbi:MAG: hypothetical protein HQL95_04165 [Magnetococcales bacterium]|nr:hypothetical protein [Magnetococcales bacterium]